MKREFLKGIEGLTDEAIDQIMAENGKDIEAEKAKTTALKAENDTLKADKKSLEEKITTLSEKADSDADYKQQLEALQKQIKEEKEAAEKEAADKEQTEAILAVFADKKFTSDYVKNGIVADMKAEILKPENKGKGYAEIAEALTKDKDGIFQNPNPPANMGGMGNIDDITNTDLGNLSMAEYIAARNKMKG